MAELRFPVVLNSDFLVLEVLLLNSYEHNQEKINSKFHTFTFKINLLFRFDRQKW